MKESEFKLKIRDLRKTYGPVIAVNNANLEVMEGEFLTLLGPSGSGKTTMLMMVAGLTLPDSGDIWIDGKVATYAPSSKRDIGMVFQNYALFPHLTVYENIAFPLRMRNASEPTIAGEVNRVLELVQLPDVGQRLPSELSGGQQQRIALARCMVYHPSIILMDEPLGALDKKLRDQMQLEIKHLHTRLGITVLYVTHDQEEAMIMSDRICVMNNSRIEQVGAPDELYFRPRTVFVASFLGESNLVHAEVTGSEGGRLVLRTANGSKVRALARDDVDVRGSVLFMVRPESLSLLSPTDQADNEFQGSLREVIMVGGVTKYYVEIADDLVIAVNILTSRSYEVITRGGRVRLGWSIDDTVVLSDSPGAGTGCSERIIQGLLPKFSS